MLRGGFIKRFFLPAFYLMFISCLTISPAFSEETTHPAEQATAAHNGTGESGEEGAHGGDRSADLRDLLYRFICVTLVVIILAAAVKKYRLMDFLSVRIDDIRKKLEDLNREKEEAERKYRDIELNLKDFEAKRTAILEQYRKQGIAERDRIINEAGERVKQIIAQSEAAFEQEIRSARNRLKQDIAEIAIGQAKEIIKKEINEKDHDDLIQEFIERVRGTN